MKNLTTKILATTIITLGLTIGAAGALADSSSDKKNYVCPFGKAIPPEVCEDIAANDPDSLSEEDARLMLTEEPYSTWEVLDGSGGAITSVPPCATVNTCEEKGDAGAYVQCCGGPSTDHIYLGTFSFHSTEFEVCIEGIGVFGPYYYLEKNHVTVYGDSGEDDIITLDASYNCWIGGSNYILLNAWKADYSTYLIAYGGNGRDYIYGTPKTDYLFGEAGNDQLLGMGGNDYIYGGEDRDDISCGYPPTGGGSDHCYGGGGGDILEAYNTAKQYMFGEAGYDHYYRRYYGGETFINDGVTEMGSDGNYVELWNGNYNDTVIGDYGIDNIYTYGGNDIINGNAGNDYIFAGDGEDKIYGSYGQDGLWGEEGDDCIWGGPGPDMIYGGGGNDLIWGEDGDDCIVGDYYANSWQGNEGRDKIDAGNGNDHVFCADAQTVWIPWCNILGGGYFDGTSGECSQNCTGEGNDGSCTPQLYGYCDGNTGPCMPTCPY